MTWRIVFDNNSGNNIADVTITYRSDLNENDLGPLNSLLPGLILPGNLIGVAENGGVQVQDLGGMQVQDLTASFNFTNADSLPEGITISVQSDVEAAPEPASLALLALGLGLLPLRRFAAKPRR